MPFAERWNGSSWSLQRIPDPDPQHPNDVNFTGVSCAGPRVCIAVGSTPEHALVDRWNGDTWRTYSTPGEVGVGDEFEAVSCPSTTACEAVGADASSGGVFAQGEVVVGGRNAAFQTTPLGYDTMSDLMAVSCVSIKVCTAIAQPDSVRSVIEQWNGLKWSIEPSFGNKTAQLYGVSCTSKADCFAVGQVNGPHHSTVPLIERWS
jgi:hypothetical protein